MILVDSGAWFAGVVTDDIDHELASQWFGQNSEQLFIIDETLTLLRARGEHRKAVEMGKMFFDSHDVHIYFLDEGDIRQTWNIFRRFSDKDWSFTDCSSKHVCEKLGITQAFSFDKHFQQFGSLTIVP